MPVLWAKYQILSPSRAVVSYTDTSGRWQGAERVEIKQRDRDQLREACYRAAEIRAASKGMSLGRLTEDQAPRDNQGRDLGALRRQQEAEARAHEEGVATSHRRHLEILATCPLADWTTVEGVLCLRSGDSNFVGVPCNGATTVAQGDRSKLFDVISLEPRELVLQLRRSEVRSWLWKRHQVEEGI